MVVRALRCAAFEVRAPRGVMPLQFLRGRCLARCASAASRSFGRPLRPLPLPGCRWSAALLAPGSLKGCRAFAAKGQRFDSLNLHENTLRALGEEFRYEFMTEAQSSILPVVLSTASSKKRGGGAVLHARTGTGKTLSYLVPIVEALARGRRSAGVGALVVAPTRELVLQITKEAERLCSYHALQVVPLIGGIRMDIDVTTIRRRRPAIIVCTPGRILEHLETTFRFATLFETLGTVVLDECDRLLGESPEAVRDLLGALPSNAPRRSFLVSATVSSDVCELAARMCGNDCEVIDCVGSGAPTQDTVEQLFVVCPPLLAMTALRNALMEELRSKPRTHKVIVFFPTARLASLVASLVRRLLSVRVHELHARCEPAARMVTQHEFSESASGLLFTAGSSERGMDYPDVTLVIQFLAPASLAQYVHRVGRTARGGKPGSSLLLALDCEERAGALEPLAALPLCRHPEEGRLLDDGNGTVSAAAMSREGSLQGPSQAAFASLLQHFRATSVSSASDAAAAQASGGRRSAPSPRLAPDAAIDAAVELMLGCGFPEAPAVSPALLRELGLQGSPSAARLSLADASAGPRGERARGSRWATDEVRSSTSST
eukprot:TRINITY_DN23970_c0_g7_i1.p1 TRINITY_DN23970_c0_g7~~TRINITY_DN23970_c0_g7_i1.p1  ORF type:complete len:605 (-),score=108.33 TRINITY_DN23970_c0_g7_i1:27-1841(-)